MMDDKKTYEIMPGDDGQPFISEELIKVILTEDQDIKYKPKKKFYPKGLLPTYNDNLVRWICNFGLLIRSSKGEDDFAGILPNGDTYEVEVPNFDPEKEILVYFSEGKVKEFPPEDFTAPNRVRVPDGDPPIGISTG